MRPIDVPLAQGLHEEADPKVLPLGGLVRAENVRWRREARIGKARSVTELGILNQSGSTLTPSRSAFLGTLAGAVSYGFESKVYVRADDAGDAWVDAGHYSEARPIRKWSAIEGYNYPASSGHDCALANGRLLVTGVIGSNTNELAILLFDVNARILLSSAFYSAAGGTYVGVRAFACGNRLVVFAEDGNDLKALTVDVSGATTPTPGAFTTLSTKSGATTSDACAYSSTEFLTVERSTADFILRRWTASTLTSSGSTTVTPSALGTYFSLYAKEGEFTVVASGDSTTWYRFFTTPPISGTGTERTLLASGTRDGRMSMIKSATNEVRVLLENGYSSSASTSETSAEVYRADSAGTVTLENRFRYKVPASALYASGATRQFFWAIDINDVEITRHPRLLNAASDNLTNSAYRINQLWDGATSIAGVDYRASVVSSGGRYYTVIPVFTDADDAGASYNSQFSFTVYEWEHDDSVQDATRPALDQGPIGYIGGGALVQNEGPRVGNVNFSEYSKIVSIAASAGGSLDASAAYQYAVCFERFDAAGRLHRSPVSKVATISTTSANKTVTLYAREPTLLAGNAGAGASGVDGSYVMRVFRTEGGGSNFYEVNSGADGIPVTDNLTSFVDAVADASITDNRTLYTQSGLLDFFTAPSHRFFVRVGSRIWCGGLFRENTVQASTPIGPTEAPSWPDKAVDFVVTVSDAVTGLGGLDDTPVIFTANSIWAVTGQGPDATGVGSFGDPRRVPSDVGCVAWQSVLAVPGGLMFQSDRGFYLLPRGFGPPQFVGGPVQVKLETYPYCLSSALIEADDEVTARFVMADNADTAANTAVLVYDVTRGQWSVDDLGTAEEIVLVGADTTLRPTRALYVTVEEGAADASVYREDSSLSSNALVAVVETGDIRVSGLTGYYRARELTVLGEFRSSGTLTIAVAHDTDKSFDDSVAFTLSGTAGDQVVRSFTLPWQKADAYRVRVQWSGTGEVFTLSGITLWAEAKRRAVRLQSADRK